MPALPTEPVKSLSFNINVSDYRMLTGGKIKPEMLILKTYTTHILQQNQQPRPMMHQSILIHEDKLDVIHTGSQETSSTYAQI